MRTVGLLYESAETLTVLRGFDEVFTIFPLSNMLNPRYQ